MTPSSPAARVGREATRAADPTISADEARALSMPLHRVTWTVDAGYGVRGEFSCDAPPMSMCRLVCAEKCGAEQWPCGGGEDEDERHRMRDDGECHALLFLGEVWAEESYDPEAPTEAVRSGPVAVRWDGDVYVWSYADGSSS